MKQKLQHKDCVCMCPERAEMTKLYWLVERSTLKHNQNTAPKSNDCTDKGQRLLKPPEEVVKRHPNKLTNKPS